MRRFLVFLFAAVFTFSTVGDAFGRRGGGGGGRGGAYSGGGGYRPSYRPSPPMARTPSYARPSQQAVPRAPQATARSTPPASRPQVSQSVRPLPRTVSPSSTVARMPTYRGQVSKAGSPIIRNAAGKPYAVPQQGTLSLRSSLASGASRPALMAAYGRPSAGASASAPSSRGLALNASFRSVAAGQRAQAFSPPARPGSATAPKAVIQDRSAARLANIDRHGGGHAHARHGAQTTLAQQKERARTGMTPDKIAGSPVNSTRFLNHTYQLHAYRAAVRQFKADGSRSGTFSGTISMPRTVGEGFYKGGEKYATTKEVLFVFRDGKLSTMYPKLPE